ncbi:hypothetical protein P6B95_01265 [Streptomyces atratus]|uniref:hypothetical protein n=1 Tax=Streptomyces atratus TaxID=1893 RepID=UPI0019C5866E|nr:hypothetical protein [Streptomyces atratus]WPW26230.1 hypothetical protein P6B95_01265 [Streptomyces atratus]GGT74846.1 hypothetical protein GCM10010207_85190 [Streptomyces atratus]
MDDLSSQEARQSPPIGASHDTPGQPGGIGIALAAVLTAALAQGSWQWFSTYIGVTLLALIFSFYRLPTWIPGLGSTYMRNLAAYSLVVGLCCRPVRSNRTGPRAAALGMAVSDARHS